MHCTTELRVIFSSRALNAYGRASRSFRESERRQRGKNQKKRRQPWENFWGHLERLTKKIKIKGKKYPKKTSTPRSFVGQCAFTPQQSTNTPAYGLRYIISQHTCRRFCASWSSLTLKPGQLKKKKKRVFSISTSRTQV